MGTAVWRRR